MTAIMLGKMTKKNEKHQGVPHFLKVDVHRYGPIFVRPLKAGDHTRAFNIVPVQNESPHVSGLNLSPNIQMSARELRARAIFDP